MAFLGWLTDTDSFYNALDVNMLTSLSEGLPYAIPEGARMHCATISTHVGAVSRIVIDGEDAPPHPGRGPAAASGSGNF